MCFEYFKHFLGLTENEILVNSIVFFAAGYDTTSNAITFAVYELARNSSMQDRLIDEIDREIGKVNATWCTLFLLHI